MIYTVYVFECIYCVLTNERIHKRQRGAETLLKCSEGCQKRSLFSKRECIHGNLLTCGAWIRDEGWEWGQGGMSALSLQR